MSIVGRGGRSPGARWRPAVVALFGAAVAFAAVPAGSASADLLPPQIHTVAGGGSCGGEPASLASGGACDGVPATSVPIAGARSVSSLPGGGYLFVDAGDDLVREVTPSGVVETVAGMVHTVGKDDTVEVDPDDAPDGYIATQSGLDEPVAVSALPDGGFLITEYAGCRVREVSPGGPGVATIATVAGIAPGDVPGDLGDLAATGCTYLGAGTAPAGLAYSVTPGPAVGDPAAGVFADSLNYPTDAEPTADGGILIADSGNDAVRYVSPDGSTITTLAGAPPSLALQNGLCSEATSDCDGVAAGDVALDQPDSVSPVDGGAAGFLVAEDDGDTVDEISALSGGTFSTVAGSFQNPGYSGDGGPATAAQLSHPDQVLSLSAGGFLIADTDNQVIREVSPSGTISTFAGDGFGSFAGDGGDATAASLLDPAAVASLANGNMLIADQDNDRIREVTIPSVSAFSVFPATPTGSNGWYVTFPTVAVSANEKAGVQCELDPAAAPTVYGEIAPGCPFTGSGAVVTGNGSHTIYAASQNSFGDQENPVSLTIKIDVGVPTVTCNGDPKFAFDDPAAQVTGTLSDSVSGPPSEPLSAPADTSAVGGQTAPLAGSNNAGGASTAQCPYYVAPLTLTPMPVAASAAKKSATARKVAGSEKSSTSSTRVSVTVRDIPQGATVEVTCTGKSCPFEVRGDVRTSPCASCTPVRPPARMVALASLFRKADVKPGTKIAVIITQPDAIGRYLLFTIRDGHPPISRSECLAPGATTKPGENCALKLPVAAS